MVPNWKSRSLRSPGAAEAPSHPPGWQRLVRALAVLSLVAAIVGGFVLPSPRADACTCQAPPDVAQMAAAAGAAFIGQPQQLNRTYPTPFGEAELWDFAVERVYVGPEASVIAVGGAAEGDSCQVDLGELGRVGVIAHWRSGHLSVGQCGIVDAALMQYVLGDGMAPIAEVQLATADDDPIGGVAAPEPATPSHRGATPRFVVTLVAASAAAAGYAVARRQRTLRERSG